MNLFYSKYSATIKRGYYGKLDVLNFPAVFYIVFDKKQHILETQNNLNNTKNKEDTTNYLDLCKIEIFLDFFHDTYIGAKRFNTAIRLWGVFRHIAQISQHWINNSKEMIKNPNNLSFKFTVLAASLP